MNLPGFYAESSLRRAGGTYCSFTHRGAGSLTSLAVPQLYRADPGHCDFVCDDGGNCALDCQWPGVGFGSGGGAGKSPKIKCIKRCLKKHTAGSAAYQACIDTCH